MSTNAIQTAVYENVINRLTGSVGKSIDIEPIIEAVYDAAVKGGVEHTPPKDFVQAIEIIDMHLGPEKAFELIERTLINQGYYSFAISCYLFLISRFKYNADIARKLAAFVQAKAVSEELSDHEWWIYCHAAYLAGNYKSLSNVSAELRRRKTGYDRILSQYLMFDIVFDFDSNVEDSNQNQLFSSDWSNTNVCQIPNQVLPVIACDSKYFKAFVVPRLQSLVDHNIWMHLAVADPDPEDIQLLLQFRRRLTSLSYSIHTFHQENFSEIDESAQQIKERKLTFYASLRFLIAKDLLQQYGCRIFTIDADSNVRFDALETFTTDISDAVGQADLALQEWHFNYGPGTSNEADLVLISPTKAGNCFAGYLKRYLISFLTSKHCYWTLDQVALNACRSRVIAINSDFKFFNLHELDIVIEKSYKNLGGLSVRGG
jgi:hypothetical protein